MWRETDDKGIHRHDDCPCCRVEIITYACPECGSFVAVPDQLELVWQPTIKVSYHRVSCDDDAPGHEAATDEERVIHATCDCGARMTDVSLQAS